ncbi:helix-turn-helix transcriptional regulator [Acuticoccus sediminis]|uniref:helix-turn-helix transcriptional regulator n=1 Tax=Acuticoccus sediminis TaxID=2184697 RepID=UPI001CFCE742
MDDDASPITVYRARHSLTLQAFALKVGVHYTTVLRIERGAREPSAKLMRAIEDVTEGEVTSEALQEHRRRLEERAKSRCKVAEGSPAA